MLSFFLLFLLLRERESDHSVIKYTCIGLLESVHSHITIITVHFLAYEDILQQILKYLCLHVTGVTSPSPHLPYTGQNQQQINWGKNHEEKFGDINISFSSAIAIPGTKNAITATTISAATAIATGAISRVQAKM